MSLGLISVTMVAVLATAWGAPQCPPGGSYFDKHTSHRECCSEICQDRKIKDSEEMCSKECPGYDSEVARQVLPNQLTTTVAPISSSESYTLMVVVVAAITAVVLGSGTAAGAFVYWRKKKRARTEEPAGARDDEGRRVDDDPLLQDEEPPAQAGHDLPRSGQLSEAAARNVVTLKLPIEEENHGNTAGSEKAI